MFNIRGKLELMLLEKNEYQKFIFRLHKLQTVELVWARERMNEDRLLRNILEWCSPGRRRRRRRNGKARYSWIQEVTAGMREKGINNLKWIVQKENTTLGTENCANVDTLCIIKKLSS